MPDDSTLRHVYRSGSQSNRNLSPRPVDTDGLSTFDSLEAAVEPGGKAQKIDVTRLRYLLATPNPPPLGHVAIVPPSFDELTEWIASREADEPHPFTLEVFDAIIEEVRRPNI